ncbi:MAG: HK97 gp10 family phage protein [Bacteroidales bacterium]|nr:HK97 gp10 family phage protein [Lachnoclostridium sp.]MCM1385127.1 HK97 gp10 family phage protein [Lachnoclostridium sp.]MCM1465529.1 HK97 gp10 family phage protein [Bacteroidales bacterium]
MGKMGSFDAKGFKEFQKELGKLQDPDAFVEACAKDLAARLLKLVVYRTPVGDYTREVKVTAKRNSKNHKKGEVYTKRINTGGKTGGTLRRGWSSKTHGEAVSGSGTPQAPEILEYANGLQVSRSKGVLRIDIINPVEYASYVEFGHRTPSHKGWVKGKFMMTISEQELEGMIPTVLEQKIRKYLEGVLN